MKINSNYAEIVQVFEEVVKRRNTAQETNDKLLKQNQELQDKVLAMEKELSRLQRRSQALDDLTMIVEFSRRL